MTDYICGAKLEADNPETAISQALFPTEVFLTQKTIHCIESPGVGINFLSWFLPLTFMGFTLFGFVLGMFYKLDKRKTK